MFLTSDLSLNLENQVALIEVALMTQVKEFKFDLKNPQ